MKKALIVLILSIAAFAVWEKAEASHHIRTTDYNEIVNTRTSIVRDVSKETKREVYKRDGVPGGNHTGKCDTSPDGCKIDHRTSLCAGGSNHIDNLMVQSYDPNKPCNGQKKDDVEKVICGMIKTKAMSIPTAQSILYNDWELAYKLLVNTKGCGK